MKIGDNLYQKRCKRYNFNNQAHELTFSCYHRKPYLLNKQACDYLAEAIIMAQQKYALDLWAYVFMPDHVHLLIWPRQEEYSISSILQTIKQSVSRRLLPHLKTEAAKIETPFHFWQAGGGYDRNVTCRETARQIIKYIHLNPVRKKLVQLPSEWYYSSYKDWMGLGCGPIAIQKDGFTGCAARGDAPQPSGA
jgi:putative transposase